MRFLSDGIANCPRLIDSYGKFKTTTISTTEGKPNMIDDDKPLEFSAKDLMPDWAQESKSAPRERRKVPHEDRNNRGGKGRGDRRRHEDQGSGRDRRVGGGYGNRDDRGGSPRGGRGDRNGGGRGSDQYGGGSRGRGDRRGGNQRSHPPEETPFKGVNASIEPTKAAVVGLTKLIRQSLRAYPLADLAKVILRERDRYQVRFRSEEGGPYLYSCETDGSLWVSRDEAVSHLLNSKAIESFYEVDIVEGEAPAGNFSVVAVCGMSGKVLGPPNHHEYQASVARLHAERFSHVPIERFKSRITMESGEEVIEKWKEQFSRTKHYRVKSGEPEAFDEEASNDQGESRIEEDAEVSVEVATGIENTVLEEAPADEEAKSTAEKDDGLPVDENAATESEPDTEEAPSEEAPSEEAPSEEAPSEEAVADEVKPSVEESSSRVDEVILKTASELAQHFKENFAESAILETRNTVVSGSIPAMNISRGLLVHLKQESEKLRRGFPLAMIQALCRALEKQGLKFFKRGKKALHVSVVRPRPIGEGTSLTEQVQLMVDYIVANPRSKVVDLLDALADDFNKPEQKKGAVTEELEMTEGAKKVLTDLRWLAAEGYVIEFLDSCVVIGKQPRTSEKVLTQKKRAVKKSPDDKKVTKASAETEAAEESRATSPDEVTEAEGSVEKQALADDLPAGKKQGKAIPEVEENSVTEESTEEEPNSDEESPPEE